MKTHLLLLMLLVLNFTAVSQPQIAGDLILCPNGEGTAYITTDQQYDTYQWYYKFWFEPGDFSLIPGATGSSFTYDWETYDQALLKVVVTQDGETFESNAIQIDSYAFLPLSVGFTESENITIDPENGNVLLCEGTTFDIEVFNPYNSNIQWYRNGVAISGADQMSYQVSTAGSYHVVAAPQVCPDFVATNAGLPIIVEINTECALTVPEAEAEVFGLSLVPNPATLSVSVSAPDVIDALRIYNLEGRLLYRTAEAVNNKPLDISAFASGVYIVQVESQGLVKSLKFVKN